jgi:hypothetical protein
LEGRIEKAISNLPENLKKAVELSASNLYASVELQNP